MVDKQIEPKKKITDRQTNSFKHHKLIAGKKTMFTLGNPKQKPQELFFICDRILTGGELYLTLYKN